MIEMTEYIPMNVDDFLKTNENKYERQKFANPKEIEMTKSIKKSSDPLK